MQENKDVKNALTGKHNNIDNKRNAVCDDDRICTKIKQKDDYSKV